MLACFPKFPLSEASFLTGNIEIGPVPPSDFFLIVELNQFGEVIFNSLLFDVS